MPLVEVMEVTVGCSIRPQRTKKQPLTTFTLPSMSPAALEMLPDRLTALLWQPRTLSAARRHPLLSPWSVLMQPGAQSAKATCCSAPLCYALLLALHCPASARWPPGQACLALGFVQMFLCLQRSFSREPKGLPIHPSPSAQACL